jgi:hypothetical protein
MVHAQHDTIGKLSRTTGVTHRDYHGFIHPIAGDIAISNLLHFERDPVGGGVIYTAAAILTVLDLNLLGTTQTVRLISKVVPINTADSTTTTLCPGRDCTPGNNDTYSMEEDVAT